jgi:hypothetical protein
VIESRVLRKMYGPEGEEVAGGWKILHNEELHNLYASLNIKRVMKLRRMMWAGHVVCMGAMRNAYNILVDKPDGKRPFGRYRCRWEGNIRIHLRKYGGRVWTGCIWLWIGTSGGLF